MIIMAIQVSYYHDILKTSDLICIISLGIIAVPSRNMVKVTRDQMSKMFFLEGLF